MKKLALFFGAGLAIVLGACSSGSVDDYAGTLPVADIKTYFNGPVKAWGIVQDRSGKVINRFDVVMSGSWQGDTGTLNETFRYYDGKTQERIWTLKKLADGRYSGTASDIIDTAVGASNGSAVYWNYEMNLPVGDTTYRVHFDDRMWLMNDGVLINRSYLKKFGFTVAELTIFMQKQAP